MVREPKPDTSQVEPKREQEVEDSLKDEIIHYQMWADNFRHKYGKDISSMQLVNAYFDRKSKVKP